eukprot:CAMPEP_0114516512 /NCGR_PEP_ID=MMETSP0109-20121206/17369_1 /TAXON_ID=29199 /ORGANISM="Chlorarachnion reptans, Strain CCCM449" /LENGTH=200 /DNA_ID=CAMNT_0001696909 /DNA_START=140 /DNA_END=742 /DNA_ORIENTATION=+
MRGIGVDFSYESAVDLNYGKVYIANLLSLTIGYMMYDVIILAQIGELKALIAVHHLVSIGLWPLLNSHSVGQMWILYFLSTEITGPFNVIRMMLCEIKKSHSEAYEKHYSMFYLINGLLFTALFVVWRLIPIPSLLVAGYRANPFRTASIPKHYEETRVLYAKFAIVFAILPILFNMFWGFQVVSGALKAFCKNNKKKKL